MSEIAVSVITPTYNMAELLPETIRSVQAQTLKNIEHIVIDDGSTDNTPEVIQSFGDAVISRRVKNGGIPWARNIALEIARGRAVIFLDADDTLAPDALELLVGALGDSEDKIVYASCHDLYLRDGAWKPEAAPHAIHPPKNDPMYGLLMRAWSVYPCTQLWPRALADRVGNFDERCLSLQDMDMLFRALLSGARLEAVPNARSYYRRHAHLRPTVSQSHHVPAIFESRIYVIGKIEAKLREAGLYETYRIPVSRFYFGLATTHFRYHPKRAAECAARAWEIARWESMPLSWPRRVLCRAVGFANYRKLARVLGSG